MHNDRSMMSYRRQGNAERTKNMAEKEWVREGIVSEEPDGTMLAGNRCDGCGQVYFPKALKGCLNCFEPELTEVRLSQRGALYSYTIVHMPASGFEPPYAVGYVDLPEGIRVFTPLEMVENRPFRVGMEMEVRIGALWQEGDKEVWGFRFAAV